MFQSLNTNYNPYNSKKQFGCISCKQVHWRPRASLTSTTLKPALTSPAQAHQMKFGACCFLSKNILECMQKLWVKHYHLKHLLCRLIVMMILMVTLYLFSYGWFLMRNTTRVLGWQHSIFADVIMDKALNTNIDIKTLSTELHAWKQVWLHVRHDC